MPGEWQEQVSEGGDCGKHIAFLVFKLNRRCAAFSAARDPAQAAFKKTACGCCGRIFSLGFVEGLNNKIRVLQRRAYGLRNEDYLRLKILTCMLPALP